MFSNVKPTSQEIALPLPGDIIIPHADIVMDRAFTLSGQLDEVWPWFIQLGKQRAGWYLPNWIEHFIRRERRALRSVDKNLQNLVVGTVIKDWGGKNATFEVAILEPYTLVYTSKRGGTNVSWAIAAKSTNDNNTRVQLRLRLAPVRRKWLASTIGDFVDMLTIAGLASGLRERLNSAR